MLMSQEEMDSPSKGWWKRKCRGWREGTQWGLCRSLSGGELPPVRLRLGWCRGGAHLQAAFQEPLVLKSLDWGRGSGISSFR